MPRTFTLAGTLKVQPKWVEAFGVTDVTDAATATHTAALIDGTGQGAANGYWKDQLSIPAGGAVALNLSALSHKAFGGSGTLAFAAVKMLMVVNNSQSDAVSIGASGSNRWASFSAGAVAVGPGGVLYAVAPVSGWGVTPTGYILTISNAGAAPAVVDVYLAGVRA